jgi:hypothetical protein
MTMQRLQGTVGEHELKAGDYGVGGKYIINRILAYVLSWWGNTYPSPAAPQINRYHAMDNTTQDLVKVSP